MAVRQLLLDTETTGLKVEEGHRVIEVACVEMINRKLTGNCFHHYVNPGREVDVGAQAIHGITNEFLKDKLDFGRIAQEFIAFITDGELIIHNAPFDLAFLNNELMLTGQGFKALNEYCQVTDTLRLARQLHAGQRNSLDALCKRYKVDNSKRELHGALLDAHLLGEVYLAMTGGQGNLFDSLSEHTARSTQQQQKAVKTPLTQANLVVLNATQEEQLLHENYLKSMQDLGACLWLEDEQA